MSGVWGNNIKISIFGESHGRAIGINIDGLEPGIELDIDFINFQMKRRAPGNSNLTTSRKEEDSFEILSGYFNGKTTGTPLCAIIRNNNTKSKDYEKTKNIIRPSHADYTGYIKYKGFNDYRGGGHFSGRITAPLVFAGAICMQILKSKGIEIASHVKSIQNIEDLSFDSTNLKIDFLEKLKKERFPIIDFKRFSDFEKVILDAKKDLDSVGGIVETAAINLPAGLGDPFFDSVESRLSSIIFSIPGIKGIEFGAGFDITKMRGSLSNDEYYLDGQNIKTSTNNNGGILGGITNGMPLIFKTAIKPTPSIMKPQDSVDINSMENVKLEIEGRHDPCIVVRAIPVIEAVTAICILDLM